MQRLSTSLTYFYTTVLPILYIAVFTGLFMALLSLEIAVMGLISFLIAGILFSLIFMFFFRGIKTVAIDNNYLYVSTGKGQTEIPLSHIQSTKENVWVLPRKVTIHLSEPTTFGNKITFLAYYQSFLFFREHPAVKEIRSKVKNHKTTIQNKSNNQ